MNNELFAMSYQLNARHSLSRQLSRIVEEQFDHIVQRLAQPDADGDAIHGARKGIKKIRAILRLMRHPLRGDYNELNALLRSAGHRLSSARDAVIAVDTIDSLHHRYPALATAIWTPARRALLVRRRHLSRRLDLVELRRDVRRAADVVPSSIRRIASRKTLRSGVGESYAGARRAMGRVVNEPADGGFHRWRRRVKEHWYHLRLMEGLHPMLRLRVLRLKQLETLLGDDHNLVLLRSLLLTNPRHFGTARDTAIILGCTDRYSSTLRLRAVTLGTSLFRRTAPTFDISSG
jgi:hypothetical protein